MEKSFCQTLNYCILCFDFEGVGSRGKTFGVLTSRWALKACFEKFFGSRNLKIDTEGKSFVNSQETSSPHSITHIKSNLKIRKFSFNSFFNIFFYKSSFPEKKLFRRLNFLPFKEQQKTIIQTVSSFNCNIETIFSDIKIDSSFLLCMLFLAV